MTDIAVATMTKKGSASATRLVGPLHSVAVGFPVFSS